MDIIAQNAVAISDPFGRTTANRSFQVRPIALRALTVSEMCSTPALYVSACLSRENTACPFGRVSAFDFNIPETVRTCLICCRDIVIGVEAFFLRSLTNQRRFAISRRHSDSLKLYLEGFVEFEFVSSPKLFLDFFSLLKDSGYSPSCRLG